MQDLRLTVLLLSISSPLAAQTTHSSVSDPELSTMRGGYQAPGGIEIGLAVQTDTSVNGALLLRSVFRAEAGMAELQAFTPRAGSHIAGQSAGSDGVSAPSAAVSVRFDRQSGVSVLPGTGSIQRIPISTGAFPAAAARSDDLDTADLAAGRTVDTAVGAVSLEQSHSGSTVHLQAAGLDVSHIFGNAFGAVVANTASDRALDTVTTVSLDLSGATPANLGSTMFRVEALGLESARMLGR